MCQINIYEAKTNLSKYLNLLNEGKETEVIICNNGVPCAKLTGIASPLSKGAKLGTALKFMKKKPIADPFENESELYELTSERIDKKW